MLSVSPGLRTQTRMRTLSGDVWYFVPPAGVEPALPGLQPGAHPHVLQRVDDVPETGKSERAAGFPGGSSVRHSSSTACRQGNPDHLPEHGSDRNVEHSVEHGLLLSSAMVMSRVADATHYKLNTFASSSKLCRLNANSNRRTRSRGCDQTICLTIDRLQSPARRWVVDQWEACCSGLQATSPGSTIRKTAVNRASPLTQVLAWWASTGREAASITMQPAVMDGSGQGRSGPPGNSSPGLMAGPVTGEAGASFGVSIEICGSPRTQASSCAG